MKKHVLPIIILSSLFGGCFQGGSDTSYTSYETSTIYATPATPSKGIETLRRNACNDLKSWGAKDAYFDEDGYLVYCVSRSDLSASGNDVARSMYQMVYDIPGTKGCKVVDVKTKKELGRFTR